MRVLVIEKEFQEILRKYRIVEGAFYIRSAAIYSLDRSHLHKRPAFGKDSIRKTSKQAQLEQLMLAVQWETLMMEEKWVRSKLDIVTMGSRM